MSHTPANSTPFPSPDASPRSRPRIPWLRIVKIVIAILMVAFIAKAIREGQGKLAASGFSLRDLHLGWMLVASLSFMAGMFPVALNWHQLLTAMGEHAPRWATVRAHYLSQLGKYVPGKAVVVALRLGMLSRFGVRPMVLFVSIVAEILAMLSVGSVVAAGSVAILYWQNRNIALAATVLAVGATVPILPPVLRFGLNFLRQRRLRMLGETDEASDVPPLTETLTLRTIAPGWLCIFPGWLCLGFSMFATMKAMGLPETEAMGWADLPWITASYAISFVAGFLSMLPGGVGVREIVMKTMIEPTYGEVVALLAPVFHRMMILITELTLGAILYLTGLRQKRGREAT